MMQSVKRASLLASRVAAVNSMKSMSMNVNQVRMYRILTQNKFINNQTTMTFNNMRAFSNGNPPSNGIYIDNISNNVADGDVEEHFRSMDGV